MARIPAPPPRTWRVAAACAAVPLLQRWGVLPDDPLDPATLLEVAKADAGLADFGDNWFQGPLGVLCEALEGEAELNALGRAAAVGQMLKVLKERLWTAHWFEERPEILATPLPPPVVVVGAMRSGTTRLHRLLAADARFSHMRFFETVCPVPEPGFVPGRSPDLRPRQAGRILSAVHHLNPRTAVIHPTHPHAPEEELGLLVASVWGMKHEAQWHVPTYGAWCKLQDPTPAYAHLARLLKLVRWARGVPCNRPWVLKTPQHALDLPALLRVFPGARVVFIHRDPVKVVGSSCSLAWNQMTIHSDTVEPARVGQHWIGQTELQVERMLAARADMPASQRIDVLCREMDSDWQSVIARVYDFLDMDLGPALPAMKAWMRPAARQQKRQPHQYRLESFGLNADDVADRFAAYRSEFDLAPRASTAVVRPIAAARRRKQALGQRVA